MSEIGKYIYGIINSNKELYFGPCGIAVCEEVYTIAYQDISAIVSDSEIVDYACMRRDILARYLVRHQKVIEKIMGQEYTIIPMRLGTFATDEDEVRHILAKAYPIVKDIFNKIHDKIEIDVATTWNDFNSVLKEIGNEKEIRLFKEELLGNSKRVSIDDQMKIGLMVKKALDKKSEEYADQIKAALGIICKDFKAHERMDDKMVANTAFLINKEKSEDFERKVEELNIKFNEKLNFRCVGPLPPYSFYTLEMKKWQFEEIDRARKRLGLFNNFATKDEIKKAHQRMAFSFHPDVNPNTAGIEREFDEVTKAYKVLQDYCRGENCSFDEEGFKKNAILVKVRS